MKDPKPAIFKDFRLCLTTWVVLEAICFVGIPLLGIYRFEDVSSWLIPSIVFGLFGSLIISLSTGAVIEAQNLNDRTQRRIRFWGARVLSLVGFLGVAFPLALTLIYFGRLLQDTANNSGA